MPSIKIGLITDTHVMVGRDTPNQIYNDRPGWRIAGYGETSIPLAITDWNASSVDLAVNLGDIVNGDTDEAAGGARDLSFDKYISIMSSISGYELFYCMGHHDLGGSQIAASDYDLFFDDTNGLGTIIPTVDPPTNAWWPTAVTDDLPCAYTVDWTSGATTWKLIFLCTIFNSVGIDAAGESGGTPDAMTQLEWLQAQLDTAEAAGNPVIVFTHQQIYPQVTNVTADGGADAVSALEGQTIKPIVICGHTHVTNSVNESNGILYFNLRGDLWGENHDDTDRFSNAIAEISYPAYTDTNGARQAVKITGSGYQSSYDYANVLMGQWLLDEAAGTSGAGSIIDQVGNSNGTPQTATKRTDGPGGKPAMSFVAADSDSIAATDPLINDFPFSAVGWFRTETVYSSDVPMIMGAENSGTSKRTVGLGFSRKSPNRAAGAIVFPAFAEEWTTGMFYMNDNKWHHGAAIFESVQVRHIYIDGLLVRTEAAGTKAFPAGVDGWVIGKPTKDTIVNKLTADLCDCRIYAGVLTQAEIKSIIEDVMPGGGSRQFGGARIGVGGRGREPFPGIDAAVVSRPVSIFDLSGARGGGP